MSKTDGEYYVYPKDIDNRIGYSIAYESGNKPDRLLDYHTPNREDAEEVANRWNHNIAESKSYERRHSLIERIRRFFT